MIETIFIASAVVAVAAAIAMIVARNAVHAALFLVVTQICLAVLFLLQGAFFIAALQVIVYAGAIMVLFIFVVMLLGVDREEALVEDLSFQRPIAIGLGLLSISGALFLRADEVLIGRSSPTSAPLPGEGNVEAVARVLFSKWALPFELTSLLLVVAVVGVMVLAKKRLQG